ncbi:hypothetical protein SAY87_016658 [Trapa incisa]|uniref:SOSEKI DIX-like domain-containing protein n=1 Tax=Trapa incisa TaxID=236973 RepID=A0AAN7L6D5_9MYRT|nr:hypothetical protein SAY87_016658 [Trapa incisa]
MAEASRRMRRMDLQLLASNKWRDEEASPDRLRIWKSSTGQTPATAKPVDVPDFIDPDDETYDHLRTRANLLLQSVRAPVVYYLCQQNGQLQQPHFIEVPLSSSFHGLSLYLRDFISRLDHMRGKGMASIYSWSSKRRYKNGFVWQDLTEDDIIYPSHGNEFILKGSELLDPSARLSLCSSNPRSAIAPPSPEHSDFEETGTAARNAWTRTDVVVKPERTRSLLSSAELSKEDIVSPPMSGSSRETLEESPVKPHRRLMLWPRGGTGNNDGSGSPAGGSRLKASSVLMQLISCGSIPFKDCGGASYSKEREGRAWLIGHRGGKAHRGGEPWNRGTAISPEAAVSSFSGSELPEPEGRMRSGAQFVQEVSFS